MSLEGGSIFVSIQADASKLAPQITRAANKAKAEIKGLTTFTASEMKSLEKVFSQGLISEQTIDSAGLNKAKAEIKRFTAFTASQMKSLEKAFSQGLISQQTIDSARLNTVASTFRGISISAVSASKATGNFKAQLASLGKKLPVVRGHLMALVKTMGFFAGVAAFGSMIRSGEEFNQKMRNSLAIMGDVSDAMRNKMTKAAMDIARVTKFSAAEVAEAYFFLASAGLNAEQSLAALPQVAKFAQAGNFGLAKATELATDAQAALGLHVEDATENLRNMKRVTDVLVKANTIADATTEQFAFSLTRKAAAAARIVGKEVEEVVAVLAAYAQQGLKGFNSGTALNIVFRDMTTKAIENKEAFKQLGVEVFDASGEMNHVADIIEDLETALAGLSDEEAKASLKMLGLQDKSLIFTQTLIGMSEKIREFNKDTEAAGGTVDEVANKQLTPTQEAVAQLEAATTSLGKKFVDRFVPIVANVASAFELVSNSMGGSLVTLAKLGIALGAGALAIKTITLAVQAYTFATQLATGATAFFRGVAGGPGALISLGAGVAAAAGAMALMTIEFGKFKEQAKESEGETSDVVKSLNKLTSSKPGADKVASSFKGLVNSLKLSNKELEKMLPLIDALSSSFPNLIERPVFSKLEFEAVGLSAKIDKLIVQAKNYGEAIGGIPSIVDMTPDTGTPLFNLPEMKGGKDWSFSLLDLLKFGQGGKGLIESMREAQMAKFPKKLQLPTIDPSAFDEPLKILRGKIKEFQDNVDKEGPLGDMAKKGLKQFSKLEQAFEKVIDLQKQVAFAASSGSVPIALMKEFLDSLLNLPKVMDETRSASEKLGNQFQDLLGPFNSYEEAMKKAQTTLEEFKSPQETFEELEKKLITLGNLFPKTFPPEVVEKGINKALEELDTALGGTKAKLADLRSEVEKLRAEAGGMSASEVDLQESIREFGSLEGTSLDQLFDFTELSREAQKLREKLELKDVAESLRDSLKTPSEELEEKINLWKKLLKSDLITKEEFVKALARERKELEGEKKEKKSTFSPRFADTAQLGKDVQLALLAPKEDKVVTELEKQTDLLKTISKAEEDIERDKDTEKKKDTGKEKDKMAEDAPFDTFFRDLKELDKMAEDALFDTLFGDLPDLPKSLSKRAFKKFQEDKRKKAQAVSPYLPHALNLGQSLLPLLPQEALLQPHAKSRERIEARSKQERKVFEARAGASSERIMARQEENRRRAEESQRRIDIMKSVETPEDFEKIRAIQEEENKRKAEKLLGPEDFAFPGDLASKNVSPSVQTPRDPMTEKAVAESQAQTNIQKQMLASLQSIEEKPTGVTLT